MTRIDVKILTAKGYDTKYLFPGSVDKTTPVVTHHARTTDMVTYYDEVNYSYDIVKGGKATHYRFIVDGGTPNSAGNDMSGRFDKLSLMEGPNSDKVRGSVEWDYSNDTASPYADSLSQLTPDEIAFWQGIYRQPFEFHFLGNKGNDTLRGSNASDELDGRKGADLMIGRGGDDTYRVDSKNDKVVEGTDAGYDRVYTTIGYTLPKNLESVVGTGSHKLALTGNSRPNDISGTAGSNTIKGLGGNDLIAGADGKDVLYGGKGKDFFMFVTPPSPSNVDTVKDFKHSADTLVVSQYAYAGLTSPDSYYAHPIPGSPIVASYTPLHPNAFHASKTGKAGDVDDRITYDTTDGRLFFDPDGTGSAQRQLIAVLTGHPHVASDDILII